MFKNLLASFKDYKTTAAGVGILLVLAGRLLQGEAVSWDEVVAGLSGVGLVVSGGSK